MTTKSALILGLVLLFGTTAFAQDYAKMEVPVGYSYMRFNPENSNIASGFAGSPCPVGCVVHADGNLFTYNVGPVFKYCTEHFEPFVEALFDGAHSNTYQNLFKACQGTCTTANNPSNNAFDFVIGGGIDIPATHSLAIRPAQFDYVLTQFGDAFTKGNQNQSNSRYQAGMVFRF